MTKLQTEFLSFQDVPGSTQLFLDFLYQFDRVKPFYAPVEPRLEALIEFAPVIREQTYPRDRLVEVLLDQNRRFGSGPETLAQIEQLRDPATVAIVTGQQAGLFTGPLYTMLKALTAIRACRDLRARGVTAVPIFWIECDDHDQAEVNHTYIINREGQPTPVIYPIEPSEAGKSISNLVLTEAISQTTDQLVGLLPPSEFVPSLEHQIRDAYAPGTGMAVAFARLMAQWFQGFGLILLDPTDVRLKRILAAFFETVIQGSSKIAELVLHHTQRLTGAGYHAQLRVTRDLAPFFVEQEQKRIGLIREDAQFVLKAGDGTYTLDELLDVARREPERLSPSVAVRPLMQDVLLPTLAYVGGPSEIAYLSQVTPLAQWLGQAATPVLPRASATLVEPRSAKVLSTYQLRLQNLFGGLDHVKQIVVERNLAGHTATLFDETERSIEGHLDQIRHALAEVDPTLARATETAREKILYQLSHLRTRFTETQAKKEESGYRQIQRACNVLYPDGSLQERQLNILHFLSRYGPRLLHQLLDALDVWRPDHHIIFLE
jgi:bacillithiol biosynthesis cysteine-adding enzyme BshC